MRVNLSPTSQEDPGGIPWPLDSVDPWDSLQLQLAGAGVGLAYPYCTPHTHTLGRSWMHLREALCGQAVQVLEFKKSGVTTSLFEEHSLSPLLHLSRAHSVAF